MALWRSRSDRRDGCRLAGRIAVDVVEQGNRSAGVMDRLLSGPSGRERARILHLVVGAVAELDQIFQGKSDGLQFLIRRVDEAEPDEGVQLVATLRREAPSLQGRASLQQKSVVSSAGCRTPIGLGRLLRQPLSHV